jgi:hypothetical protein
MTLLEILRKSKEQKQIIGFWKYNDENAFWAGYVLNLNEELVSIQHYTEFGKPDGIIVEQLDNIKSVDYDDDYAKAMHYLIENAAQIDQETSIKLDLSFQENWQISLLKQLVGTNNIVRVEIKGSEYYSGFILTFSKFDFILQRIGDRGEDEGKSLYRIEDLTAIRINDIENRKKALLHKWRKTSW